jgi:hypothetical protein
MANTKRVALFLTVEAAEVLPRLAPSENKQGAYVSELIMEAARERGLVETPPEDLNLAALQHQLQAAQQQLQHVQAHYDSLLTRVTAALERQQRQ